MEEYILEIFHSREELCAKYKIDNIKILKLDDEGAKTKLALIKTKRGIRWEGTSPSGVKIEGFLNKKGTRAFPKYEGGN